MLISAFLMSSILILEIIVIPDYREIFSYVSILYLETPLSQGRARLRREVTINLVAMVTIAFI